MRDLKRQDLPALTQILKDTGAFTEEEIQCALELLHIVLDNPEQQDYEVAVAEDERRVAGYVLYGPVPLTEGNYDIYWIATDPNLHGKGFGKALVEHVENEIRSRGGRLICLETSSQASYTRTRRFYVAAGFVEESRIRDFYRSGDDRITYVKRI